MTKSGMMTKSGNKNEHESVSSWADHDHDCRSVYGKPYYSCHRAFFACLHNAYFVHVEFFLTQIGHGFLSLCNHLSCHSSCAELKDS